MNSGIYVLRFTSGHYYIGRSDNIPKRWEQHFKDFTKGQHSKKMQECFDRYGPPTKEVFLYCHSDHIDLYESIIIRMNLGPMCLNTTLPKEVPPDDADVLMRNGQWVSVGTAEHFRMLTRLENEIDTVRATTESLQAKLDDLEVNGIRTPEETEDMLNSQAIDIAVLSTKLSQAEAELERLRNRNMIERLLNR